MKSLKPLSIRHPTISITILFNPIKMDTDNIWLVASTFVKCYKYHWIFPISFSIENQQLNHMERSITSTFGIFLVRSFIFATAFSSLAILFLVNISTVRLLDTKQILICAVSGVIYVSAFVAYYELSGKMEILTNVANALVDCLFLLERKRK